MSVALQTPFNTYTGNGVTTSFAYNWLVLQDTDMAVYVGGTLKALGIDYNVTGVGALSGGFVLFLTAPANGAAVTLERAMLRKRDTDYQQAGDFLSAVVNADFDRAILIAQDLAVSLGRSIRVPDYEPGASVALPAAGVRANTYPSFDASGNLILAATLPSGTLSQSAIGGFMWPRTSGELGAGQTPANYFPDGPILDMRRWSSSFNTGVDITAAVTSALASGYRRIWLPAGHNLLDNLTIALDDVVFIGDGDSSRLTVLNANSRLWNVTGKRFRAIGLRCEGDGTSASSITGVGAYLNDAEGAVFEDVLFDSFGFGGISGASTAEKAGPRLTRVRWRNTAAGGTDLYLGGIFRDTVCVDCDWGSTAADRGMLIFDNTTTGWQGVTVRGGYVTGYQKQGLATTDENWDSTDRVWTAEFDGVRIKSTGWEGIKCKTSRNVKIVNCTFDNCETGGALEDSANGLYGSILCNSLGDVTIKDNTIRNAGSEAIRCNAPTVSQYPQSNPGGLHNGPWNIEGNQIENTGIRFATQGNGITLQNGFTDGKIIANTVRGCGRFSINVPCTAATPFRNLTILANDLNDNTVNNAINVQFGMVLNMDKNQMRNCSATGVVITDVENVNTGTDFVLDPSAAGGRGMQISNYKVLTMRGTRMGNSTYAAWVALTVYTLGQIVNNGGQIWKCVVAGTSGNTGGPVAVSGGVTEGTVTWFNIGKYQLMANGLRLTGTGVKADIDIDATGCTTGPIEALVVGSGGITVKFKTSLTTATATANQVAWTVPLPTPSGWHIDMQTNGWSPTTPDSAGYGTGANAYRNGAGTVLVGSTNYLTNESAAGMDANIAASGNSVVGRVTAASANSTVWNMTVIMQGGA